MKAQTLLNSVKRVVPTLSFSKYKGQAGKLCVVGGCLEFTGAPYFVGISALTAGLDMVSVFCTSEAAVPIKSYSPELMVYPYLHTNGRDFGSTETSTTESKASVSKMLSLFPSRATVVSIGSGLGRDDLLLHSIAQLLPQIDSKTPLVIDADGLYLLTHNPKLIHGRQNTVLTPNSMEFRRLWQAVFPKIETPPLNVELEDTKTNNYADLLAQNNGMGGLLSPAHPLCLHTSLLAKSLGGVTICRKGPIDIISNGATAMYCCEKGSPRRCGGQGDLLSGVIAAFSHWANSFSSLHPVLCEPRVDTHSASSSSSSSSSSSTSSVSVSSSASTSPVSVSISSSMLAAFSGCFIARQCARKAFAQHGRSMMTSHMIVELESVVNELFPVSSHL